MTLQILSLRALYIESKTLSSERILNPIEVGLKRLMNYLIHR